MTQSSNEPCWCGSGKKYLRCHEVADRKSDLYIDSLKTGRKWLIGTFTNERPFAIVLRTE